MILLTHLLLGALIGEKINLFFVAIILALLSHYFIDIFPHSEYSIENIKNNQWGKSLPDFLKVILDFLVGILIISIFTSNGLKTYFCAFVAIIPDGISLLFKIYPSKLLIFHDDFHDKKIHFLKNKKIPQFWRFLTQAIIIVAIILLF